MKIRDLRDWPSCLASIRQWLDYSTFNVRASENKGEDFDYELAASDAIEQEIAEGMLCIVLSRPQPEVAPQLEQFAGELAMVKPDPMAAADHGLGAKEYGEFFREFFAPVQRGLPAVVETFKAYGEGTYDLHKETDDLLEEAQDKVPGEPQAALTLIAAAGALYLRGLGEVDELSLDLSGRSGKRPLRDWVIAVASVIGRIADELEEYPLGEVELARDQWRAPDDADRMEYKKAKLARLGIVDPEVQALLLPLLVSKDQQPSAAEKEAITAAESKVVPGLIAIAGDYDSQLQCSISEGEAGIRAVNLLGNLRAAEAVPTLLEILKESDVMAIIHDQSLQVLQDDMPDLAFNSALEMFDHTKDVELKSDLAGILANGGRGKPGVFERLIKFFREEKDEQGMVAVYLARFGDPRALPDLQEAFRRADRWLDLGEIEEAIIKLGGELSAAEKRKSERLRTQFLPSLSPARKAQPTPPAATAPLRSTKVGRNEPCPCGSGKKYKKCCGR